MRCFTGSYTSVLNHILFYGLTYIYYILYLLIYILIYWFAGSLKQTAHAHIHILIYWFTPNSQAHIRPTRSVVFIATMSPKPTVDDTVKMK
jgi:hypothetical protein